MLLQILQNNGRPVCLYGDQHTIFRSPKAAKLTIEDELNGIRLEPTQFGKALQQLGIIHIHAASPQAKGRIERLWQTCQDRLTKEMVWAGISTIEEAQAFLEEFIPRYNERFAVAPQDPPACLQTFTGRTRPRLRTLPSRATQNPIWRLDCLPAPLPAADT
ncbi:MAG: integrase core domain-containing protein [Limnochordia bacterium]